MGGPRPTLGRGRAGLTHGYVEGFSVYNPSETQMELTPTMARKH